MRTLPQALLDHELIVLRVIGEWWDLDLTGADKAACVEGLAGVLGALDLEREMSFLPPEEVEPLRALLAHDGRLPVSTFMRQFGDVRQMGPGRLEQEEPWYDPVSPAEALWYRGLIYRGFDRTAEGMVEFFYVPTDLRAPMAPVDAASVAEAMPASLEPAPEPERFAAADTRAVDDLTTILAAAQIMPLQEENLSRLDAWLLQPEPARRSLLLTLAWEMGFLRETPDGIRPARTGVAWLRQGREAQARALAEAWSSCGWNELRHTPGLICEGSGWENDPIVARNAVLQRLPQTGDWYHLDDLVRQIELEEPDFQRPDGNYDTWYVRDAETNAYLTGFESWPGVEGRLLRFLVRGPLHWLGLSDLAMDVGQFRLTTRARAWLGHGHVAETEVAQPIKVMPDGTILVPQSAGRFERFQIARVAEPQPVQDPGQLYLYRLTPASLGLARDQGIDPGRVLSFLAEVGGQDVPAGIRRAVERWASAGTEAFLEHVVVLRVADPEILDKLRSNPRANPFLGESLGDLAVVVTDWDRLQQVTAQLGLFIEVRVWE